MQLEVLVNKMDKTTAAKLKTFMKQLAKADATGKEERHSGHLWKYVPDSKSFPYLASGITAAVSKLTKTKVIRVQHTSGMTNDRYLKYIDLCTKHRSKHFPKIDFVAVEKDGEKIGRVFIVMEKLESLYDHDLNRSKSQEAVENFMYTTWRAIDAKQDGGDLSKFKLDLPVEKDGLAGTFSKASIVRVWNKAVDAGLHMNDCHSGNMMLRVQRGKKTLVITDPVV